MAIVQSTRYGCFARFTFAAQTYAVGTDHEYRSSVWHEPYLLRDTAIEQHFTAGSVIDANGFDLTIADVPGGVWQTLVANSVLDGTSVTVETVCTSTLSDGTTSTQTKTETLSVRGTRIERGRAIITLVDMEDAKLATLYPTTLWSADRFRSMAQADTGIAIPYPVGTARKLRAVLLSSDTINAYYYYGVCNAPYLAPDIVAINTGSRTFSIAGDYTDRVSAGSIVYASATSANPGRYTVTGAVYSAPNTVITVSELLLSATASGTLYLVPTVLAVYRDGRLVPSSEYTVQLLWPAASNPLDADFDNSPVDWTTVNSGTGTAALTGGVGRFTGTGVVPNYGSMATIASAGTMQPGAFYGVTLTLATAGRIRLGNNAANSTGNAVMNGLGTHTAFVQQVATAGTQRITLSNYNTGYSGTVDVDNISLNTTQTLLMLRFTSEQVAYDGSAHSLEVDVRGIGSRNVADEIARLLIAVNCSVDGTTYAAAQSYASTHQMLVDCDHGALVNGDGGSTGQRRVRAILEDLLFIARGSLYRTAAGAYGIVQDQTGTSSATYSEDAGDLITVASVQRPPRPSSVGISYLPNAVDPSRTTHTITRTVSGGVLGDEKPREVRYLSDHTAADRLLCYLALREQYNRRIKFRQYLQARALGDVIDIISTDVGISTALPVWVTGTQQIPAGVDCDAIEYNASVHTYTAGTLPADASATYQPDYSKTPPAAPTSLTITAGSTALGTDGSTVARITVTAVVPSVNWAEIWFTAIHNTTGEITGLFRGTLISGSTYGGTLTGLRPGEVYQLQSYAVNSFSVTGSVQNTFNATAIGGGGAATTFTAPGYATLPANVSSCTATQGMGRLIEVTWTAVTTANLREYALERRIGAGAYSEVWRGRTRSYMDRNVAVGSSYQYRVRAVDTYGNLSASYATSGSVAVTGNVVGGDSGNDITSDTITTYNRSATSSFSTVYTNPGAAAANSYNFAHSLGKVPLLTVDVDGKTSAFAALGDLDSTDAEVILVGVGNGQTADTVTPAAGVLHDHFLAGYVEGGDIFLRVW